MMTFLLWALNTFAYEIVNGEEVPTGAYSEVIKIQIVEDQKKSACTGFFISDEFVLTEGHCFLDFKNPEVFIATQDQKPLEKLILGKYYTEFNTDEYTAYFNERSNQRFVGYVEGCRMPEVRAEQSLVFTKNLDLALIRFPRNTSQKWAKLNMEYVPQLLDPVVFLGYGSTENPYFTWAMTFDSLWIEQNKLRLGRNQIWRIANGRIAFKNPDAKVFASISDSGGPIYYRNEVVAVLSTFEQNCETPFGADYGIVNTGVLLSEPKVREFLLRAAHFLK